MKNKADCVYITCDNCEQQLLNADGETVYLLADSLKEQLDSYEWITVNNKHYCPNCAIIHNDTVIIDGTRKKDWYEY